VLASHAGSALEHRLRLAHRSPGSCGNPELRASLVESVKVQIEKLEFSLSKMYLRVVKQLAQNIHCKLELKNGIFENYRLLHKN
jgi:hypothetical protein